MTTGETVICVGCPLGCEVVLTLDEQEEVTGFTGNACKEGREYALEEYKNPVRVLTTTILTENSSLSLLPVRTNRPVLKGLLKPAMLALAGMRVTPPIRKGDIIVSNLLGTGANLVAGGDLPVGE